MPNNLGNKATMSTNIIKYMKKKGVNATEICKALNIPMPTFSDWVNARTYPRIDKIEKMANYFGVTKADLVEEGAHASPEELTPTQQRAMDLIKTMSDDDLRKFISMGEILKGGSK